MNIKLIAGYNERQLMEMEIENLEDVLKDEELEPLYKIGATIRLHLMNAAMRELDKMIQQELMRLDVDLILLSNGIDI